MSTLGFIGINIAPFKVFIFSMSTLKGAFHKGFEPTYYIIKFIEVFLSTIKVPQIPIKILL